jgi:hypothetical protein
VYLEKNRRLIGLCLETPESLSASQIEQLQNAGQLQFRASAVWVDLDRVGLRTHILRGRARVFP